MPQAADPLETIEAAEALCADQPDSIACATARLQSEALMVQVIAEAGNTRDRGAFIDLVRAVLTDPSPAIRTSAFYALAKLQPDAADTPAIMAALQDPASDVRGAAWAAAFLSPDPVARRVVRRVPERPESTGTEPSDPARAYDPAALGFALPEGAAYLSLTADRRNRFQLEFLTPEAAADVTGWAATLGPVVPLTDLLATDPAAAALALGFLDAESFGDPQVVRLPPEGDRPLRLVLIYGDLVFGQTGIAVVFAGGPALFPPDGVAEATVPDAKAPVDTAALARLSVLKPDAPGEESDLFVSILLADGYGAEDYLELYPEGAYAKEARAIVAGPRLILDDINYSDTDIITARFANLPVGATANLAILNASDAYATEASQFVSDTTVATQFDTEGRLAPGVYLLQAEVWSPDGGDPITLSRDFSITAGLAELATDKTDFAPGETITVRFSGMSGDDQDYISTALAGSENASYATYAYTGGLREGSVTLPAPTTPGDYELRAFFREDETVLRASLPITVLGTAAVAEVIEPQENVVPPAGEPAPDARATLALDKTIYAPGEKILVTYSGMFGDRYDYVTTVVAGAPWNAYLSYVYTEGALDGTATLPAPNERGTYEVRAFFKEDESILRGSATFEVR